MRRQKKGGTLIELLVALVLLDLALLFLAAMAAATAKRVGDAERRSRAATAAANRVERMSALPCSMIAGGAQQIERGVNETWSVIHDGRTAEITDSIDIGGRPPQRIVIRRRSPCS